MVNNADVTNGDNVLSFNGDNAPSFNFKSNLITITKANGTKNGVNSFATKIFE